MLHTLKELVIRNSCSQQRVVSDLADAVAMINVLMTTGRLTAWRGSS